MIKIIIILSVFAMLFLTGCRAGGIDESDNNGSESNVGVGSNEIGARPEYDIVRPEKPGELFTELLSMHRTIAGYGEGFFVYATTVTEPEIYRFYFCNVNEGSMTLFHETLTKELHVSTFQVMSDGSLLVAGWQKEETHEDGSSRVDDSIIYIYHISGDEGGDEAKRLIEMPGVGIQGIEADGQKGQIYVHVTGQAGDLLSVHSLSGYFLYEIAFDAPVQDIIFSGQDRSLYAMQASATGMSVLYLDEGNRAFQTVAYLQGSAATSVHQSSTYAFYAVQGSNVFGYDPEALGQFTRVFDLSRHGIAGWVPFILELDSRYIVCVVDIMTNITSVLWLMAIGEYDGPVETLRLGVFVRGRDHILEEMIAQFNFYNPQYIVEIVDYSEYGNEATTRLNLDIITGNAPDLFQLSGILYGDDLMPIHYFLPIHSYISSGMLVDLAPYMRRDLELDNYWPSAMQALFIGDACYFAVPSFSLYAIAGSSEAVGALDLGGFNEFLRFLRNDIESDTSQFVTDMTQSEFVADIVLTNMEQFVDYSSGTAYFDSEEFISLLETANLLTPSEDWVLVSLASGSGQLTLSQLRYFNDLETLAAALYGNIQAAGFPGYPPGTAMIPTQMFGISATTQNVEGAWAFLREMYEDENFHNLIGSHLPINKASFSSYLDRYTVFTTEIIESSEETDMPVVLFASSEGFVSVPYITIEQVDVIANLTQSLIEQIDRIYIIDIALMNIIKEELTTFFNGNRTAADTARVVQSRAQLYLWEMVR